MDRNQASRGINLNQIHMEDAFFQPLMETVRTKMIPYQWKALNDQVEDATPSYCMRNFRIADELGVIRRTKGQDAIPVFPTDVFYPTPKSPEEMEDRFYGFLFQDTDLYKWLEAVAYSLALHKDEELEALADGAIDMICKAQYEDGYLDTYYIINDISKRFTNLRDHHELYCLGHLTEAAVAYYQSTGKDALLKAAMKYADCVDRIFGKEEGKKKGYPGHEIAEMALMRLYEVTGEERYLNLAQYFVDERGKRPYYFALERSENGEPKEEQFHYHQAHKPVREQEEAVGHAVRAVYLYTGMAQVAKCTNDEKLYEACLKIWNNIMNQKLYITGGIGASPEGEAFSYNYNLPNDKMYNETCASIGLIFFARRMLEICPKSEYADVMERALYNGVLSGMDLDGQAFFYVNPLEVEPEGCKKDAQRKQVALPRQKWFGCACCPPNLARLITSIPSYAYSSNDTTLFMHLYVGGQIKQSFQSDDVTMNVKTAYPWKDTIELTMDMKQQTSFTLAIRIPGWCNHAEIRINGVSEEITTVDGYLYMQRMWNRGDQVQIRFPMEPQFYQADERVRADIGKVALMRGPLVYCLEEADNGNNLHLVKVNPTGKVRAYEDDGELGHIVRLDATGTKIERRNQVGLYRIYQQAEQKEVVLRYIPYYAWCNRGVGEMMVYVNTQE